MLFEVLDYMRRRGWRQITLNRGGNSTLLTGGLYPRMRSQLETWLKVKKWSDKIEK